MYLLYIKTVEIKKRFKYIEINIFEIKIDNIL